MTDPLDHKLRELSWRPKLTDAEAAELRAHLAATPEAQAEWADEVALNEMLNRLPDAPIASNFTARVLQAVEHETAPKVRVHEPRLPFWWRGLRWLPGAAAAMLVLGAGLFAYQRYEAAARRVQLVEGVMAVSGVAGVPGPGIFKDFEAIRRLSTTPPADEELLALLK